MIEIFLKEKVGILLIIINPTIINIKQLRYAFFKKGRSIWRSANKVNRINPAAAGDGTPTKYLDLFIGWSDKKFYGTTFNMVVSY